MNLSKNKNDFSVPVKQAQSIISERIIPLEKTELLPLQDALFKVAAEDVVSKINVPFHDNAAMDGYAFSAQDRDLSKPLTLKIAGAAFAGHPFLGAPKKEECVQIMTGAFIPDGCDTVVQQENVTIKDGAITMEAGAFVPGDNVRLCGEDIKAETICLKKGTLLKPAHLGLLASVGLEQIQVVKPPVVAILTTGDELVSVGKPLSGKGVYDSNRYLLYGMLKRLGCDIMDLGIVKDRPEEIEAAFLKAAEKADLIITTGGVSVGDADYTKTVLEKMAQIDFWNINMRPGRPTVFGKIANPQKNTYVFGLPGNPVAVMVAFYFFVRDAVFYLMGARPAPLARLQVKTLSPLKKRQGRTEFQRGIVTQDEQGNWVVRSTGAQGSGLLTSMTQANCMIILPANGKAPKIGEEVEVVLFDGLI